jgi:hypothetical protein
MGNETREKYETLGLCGRCGKESHSKGRQNCQGCIDQLSTSRRARRQGLASEGLCVDCGKVAEPGKKQCFYCLARGRRIKDRRQARLLAAGLCVKCGHVEPAPGGKTCLPCRVKLTAQLHRGLGNPKARKAQGLCPTCGGEPETGKVHCFYCLSSARANSKRLNRDRVAAGVCYRCGGELDDRWKSCSKCRAHRNARRKDHE